jgi:hypothetical protein
MTRSSLALAAAVTLAAVLAAGCESSPRPVPSPTPAATSSTAAIAAAASAECASFAAADQEITSGTQLDTTVGELTGALHAEGPAWGSALQHAAAIGSASRVPDGPNRAREIGLAIGRAGIALGFADLDADLGNDQLPSDWTKTVRALEGAAAACAAP